MDFGAGAKRGHPWPPSGPSAQGRSRRRLGRWHEDRQEARARPAQPPVGTGPQCIDRRLRAPRDRRDAELRAEFLTASSSPAVLPLRRLSSGPALATRLGKSAVLPPPPPSFRRWPQERRARLLAQE